MIATLRAGLMQGLVSVALFATLIALTGCADAMTYASLARAKGIELYEQQSYSDAAGAFRNATRQDPRDHESHYYLGLCYDQMKLHQQAFTEYRTTLDVMRRTLAGRSDPQFRLKAIETYAASIAQHDSGDAEMNSLTDRAAKNQRAEEWQILAKVYRLRGDADLAIDAYRRAAGWDNKDFELRKEFGLYLLELNQTAEARKYLNQAYQLKSYDEQVTAALQRLGALPASAVTKTPTSVTPERTVQVPRD